MAYDLEEQEQIATFKAFWNQYGNFILTAVTVVLLAVAGYRGWGWYEAKQAGEAAGIYDQLRAAAERGDIAKVKESSGTIFEQYARTAYGQMAALVAARAYHDAGDLKSARAPLQWAIDKAPDDEFRQLARLSLAAVLLDEKAYDEGLALLSADKAGRFAGAFADRRGDLLLAKGSKDEARQAYAQALEKLDESSPLRRAVQLKHDALGGVAQ